MSKQKYYIPSSRLSAAYNKQDPLTRSWFIKKLIGCMPLKSKNRNRSLVFKVLDKLRVKNNRGNPTLALVMGLHRAQPTFWIKVIRKGKREYRIPVRLTPLGRYKKSIR